MIRHYSAAQVYKRGPKVRVDRSTYEGYAVSWTRRVITNGKSVRFNVVSW